LWLKLGGLVGGVPALLFIILANVGTVLVGVNVSAIGLEQLSWNATTGFALDDSTSGVAKHRHPLTCPPGREGYRRKARGHGEALVVRGLRHQEYD